MKPGKRSNPIRAADPRAPSAPAPKRVELSRRKKLLFGAAAVLIFLAGLEGVLALCGIKPQLYEKDPYVGFSTRLPLFVEEKSPDGKVEMVTARNRSEFFNLQRFPKVKGPGVYRVFAMGGSTTYGHPYNDATSFNGWLREYLRGTAPERSWELINAGGISYGSYRVAQLMEELIRYQPDLFIIYSGQNEFLERRIYSQVPKMPRALQGLTGLAWRTRSATLVERALEPLRRRLHRKETAIKTVLESDPVTLLDNSLGPTAYTRDDALRRQIFEHYRYNLYRMLDIAQSVGARVIFINPASNLREASPFKSEHRKDLTEGDRQRWKQLYDQAREDFASPTPTNALAALAEAEAIDPLPASLHFVRGRVLEKLGRFAEAKAAYERARDEDVCPLRAPSEIGRVLASVAAQRKVPFIDYAAFVETHSEHGIPGAGMFLDHVHPTIEGYRLLALEILKTMEREGIVRPNWDPALLQRITQDVSARIDTRAHAFALMNLCKTLGWAGKREEAYRAGKRALELGPMLPEVQYQAGLAAQLCGRTNEAVACYRRAVELQPDLAKAYNALGVISEDRGALDEALVEYRSALRHGKPAEAERHQRNIDSVLRKLGSK